MPDTKRAWISILIAAAIIVAIAALTTLVGSTALFFYRHSSAEFVSSESAADQLARTRSRFGGKRPLIDFNVRDEPVLHREDAPSAAVHQLTTLFILAYDTRARKLVRVNI